MDMWICCCFHLVLDFCFSFFSYFPSFCFGSMDVFTMGGHQDLGCGKGYPPFGLPIATLVQDNSSSVGKATMTLHCIGFIYRLLILAKVVDTNEWDSLNKVLAWYPNIKTHPKMTKSFDSYI